MAQDWSLSVAGSVVRKGTVWALLLVHEETVGRGWKQRMNKAELIFLRMSVISIVGKGTFADDVALQKMLPFLTVDLNCGL